DAILALPESADSAARVRDLVAADPTTLLDVAAAISHGRGRWPADAVSRAIADGAPALGGAPGARLREGTERAIVGRDVDAALEWLLQVGALALLFPELAATVDLQQESGRLHKDVWAHTKLVVKQAVRRPDVRWAALLHDIGKVPT